MSSFKEKSGRQTRRQYTKEFKEEAVRLAGQPGMRQSQVARDLGISRSLLSSWTKALEETGTDAFRGHGNRRELEEKVSSLQRQLRIAEQERDILDAAWQGPYSQGGANPPQVTARHGPDIQPWRHIGNDVLYA